MNSNIVWVNWNKHRHFHTVPIYSWLGTMTSVTPSTTLVSCTAEHANTFCSSETADGYCLKERTHIGGRRVSVCDFSQAFGKFTTHKRWQKVSPLNGTRSLGGRGCFLWPTPVDIEFLYSLSIIKHVNLGRKRPKIEAESSLFFCRCCCPLAKINVQYYAWKGVELKTERDI